MPLCFEPTREFNVCSVYNKMKLENRSEPKERRNERQTH